ncbi:putative ADP-ribosylation factor GTPase-activating protein agd15-like, partial [Balamuthia mandrillaris]
MSKSKEKEEKEKTATFRIGSSIGKIFNKKDKQRAETLHSTVYSSSPHQQPPSSSSSLAENGGEEAAESGVLPEESPLPEEMSIYMKEMQETAARARTSTMKARLNDVVLSGFLLKLSSNLIKGWRKHWCVLERDELLYYKNKKDLEPAGKISMFLCSIKVTKNNGFDIATPNLVHHFQAENAEQQNEWVNRMQKLSEGLLTTPTLRRTREDRHTVTPNKIKHQVSPEPTDLAYSARMPTSKSSSTLPTTSSEESPRVKQRKAAATVSTTSSKNKSALEKKAKERGSEREKDREEDKKKDENAKGKDKSDELANLILEQRTEAMRKRAASRGSMFKIRRHSSRDCVNGDGAIPESLSQFAALPENHVCVECGDSEPRWVSINLGVFLCLVCSGIHRSLGVHISKIRSLDLDMWTEESVKELVTKGNAAHRKVWEEDIPPSWRTKRPSPDDTYQRKEKWIRAKYILRKFSREGKIYPSFKAQVSTKQKKPINYLKLPPIGVNSWIEGNSVHLFGPTTASCQDYYKQTVFCRSVSLFPKNPQRQHCHHNDYEPSLSRLYDPLVQCYGVQQHHNVTLLALAAGCNW